MKFGLATLRRAKSVELPRVLLELGHVAQSASTLAADFLGSSTLSGLNQLQHLQQIDLSRLQVTAQLPQTSLSLSIPLQAKQK